MRKILNSLNSDAISSSIKVEFLMKNRSDSKRINSSSLNANYFRLNPIRSGCLVSKTRSLLVIALLAAVNSLFPATGLYADSSKSKNGKNAEKEIDPQYLSDPRGPVEVIICSQNLHNYGQIESVKKREPRVTKESLAEQESALIKRFVDASCDLIAVQEVLGKSESDANAALERLAVLLRGKTGRIFRPIVGTSGDPLSRVGFLVAMDRGELVNSLSYSRVELPKFADKDRPRFFGRGPLEIQVVVKGRGESAPKTVTLVNMHFKSKGGKDRDPAELDWETYRIQMAEALRRILEQRHSNAFAQRDNILVVLGDRNSHWDAASAKVLEGTLTLDMFRDTTCRLSKRGVALCKDSESRPQRLFSVLTSDPQTKVRQGSYHYKSEFSWLDDILLPAESLSYGWDTFDSEGDYASGVIYEPKAASDHALVYLKLNW